MTFDQHDLLVLLLAVKARLRRAQRLREEAERLLAEAERVVIEAREWRHEERL